MSARKNRRAGQCFIEVSAGLFILVPLALFFLDVVVMVLANSANDTLAKNAARAAADQKDQSTALTAAQQVVERFPKSTIINAAALEQGKFQYNSGANVYAYTTMSINLPAALPGLNAHPVFH